MVRILIVFEMDSVFLL